MKRVICISLLSMTLFMSCSVAPVEKSITVSKVNIVGNANEFIKVVDGTYTFKPIENNIHVAIRFELIKQYKGDKPKTGNISIVPLDNSNNTIPDIGLNFSPATSEDYDKISRILKSKVGEQITINFEWSYFSNSEKQKRILENINFFEITNADITEETSQIQNTSSTMNTNNDWDKLLNDYEKFVENYVALYKKAINGDNSAIQEYPALLEKAEELEKSLKNAENDGSLSESQINRLVTIQQKLANVANISN